MDLEHLQLSALLIVATLELRQARAGLDGTEEARQRLAAAAARAVAARDVTAELLALKTPSPLAPRV
ncbi:MAG TPA: hypothetical protein VK539_09095 [Myxococcaceae bacterium]|nr:hypothetical protein [Myxococcaceae bacterium]